jgi:gamma-glutamyltranspeptidase/glutathione hydrolase
MVSSPHSLASSAGVGVMRAGGSAVDAALATTAALSVLYPHMTGIGGDAFWLIWDARTKQVRYIDGGGRATSGGTIDAFARRGLSEVPVKGVLPGTLTVPGSVASWSEAHAAYGRLPLARCLESAIGYARDGFPVTARLAFWRNGARPDLEKSPEAAAIFLEHGPVMRNPDLARTLQAIASDGWYGFYDGEVGRELVRWSLANDGFFTASDLRAQQARWEQPIKGTYRDVTIYETPPPTQGFAVLEMLNLLEPFELHTRRFLGPDYVHLMVQAKQLAYHDRDHHIADPKFADVPTERLVSKAYAKERRSLMDPERALPWDKIPSYGSLAGDTVYVAAVDKEGNAVSLIQSLYGSFGAAVVAGRTGVVLQNRSAYFSLDPRSPNRVEPGKTPLHTLIASLAFRDDSLWAVVGCMGADGQPQIHLQTYVAMIDHGRDIQEALETPRFLSGRFAIGEARDTLHIEARVPAATIDALEKRGHLVNRWGDWNEYAGHAHGIVIDPASGLRIGGSDPRSDGAAIGY